MRRGTGPFLWWFAVVAIGAGSFVLGSVGEQLAAGQESEAVPEPPPGWHILLPDEDIMALAEQGDVIWAGGKNGVFKIGRRDGEPIEKLDLHPAVTYVRSLLVDQRGRLWVGYENGIAVWDGDEARHFTSDNGLPDNRVNSLLQDSKGRIWVGTWGGAAVFDGGTWRHLTQADGLGVNMVNVILEDRLGGMWFGAYAVPGRPISILLKGGGWQYFSTEDLLPHNSVTAMIEDGDGTVWVGTGFDTRGGAARFEFTQGRWLLAQVMTKGDGLAGEKVRSLFVDSLGTIWFGSEYDGVALYRDGRTIVLTTGDGLSDQEIKAILQDGDGNVWLGSRSGLTKIDYGALTEMVSRHWR